MNNDEYTNMLLQHLCAMLGDKWSMTVLNAIHNPEGKPIRFVDLQVTLKTCSRKMLSSTLKKQVENGLVNRIVHPIVPPCVEYSLTDEGKELIPCITVLLDWARVHLSKSVGNQITD